MGWYDDMAERLDCFGEDPDRPSDAWPPPLSEEQIQHHVALVERDAVVSGYEKAKREFRAAWREVPRRAKLWGRSDSEIDKRAFFQAVNERRRAREQFVLARAAYRSLK